MFRPLHLLIWLCILNTLHTQLPLQLVNLIGTKLSLSSSTLLVESLSSLVASPPSPLLISTLKAQIPSLNSIQIQEINNFVASFSSGSISPSAFAPIFGGDSVLDHDMQFIAAMYASPPPVHYQPEQIHLSFSRKLKFSFYYDKNRLKTFLF